MAIKTVVLLALVALGSVQAYPHFWAEEYAPSCTAVPTKGAHCHKAPKEDTSVSITVTDGSGKVVQTVCPGQSYSIGVRFPDARLAYVALSSGTVSNASTKKCPNAVSSSKKGSVSPSTSFTTRGTAPASGSWVVNVASATGECAPFMISRASLNVGKC